MLLVPPLLFLAMTGQRVFHEKVHCVCGHALLKDPCLDREFRFRRLLLA